MMSIHHQKTFDGYSNWWNFQLFDHTTSTFKPQSKNQRNMSTVGERKTRSFVFKTGFGRLFSRILNATSCEWKTLNHDSTKSLFLHHAILVQEAMQVTHQLDRWAVQKMTVLFTGQPSRWHILFFSWDCQICQLSYHHFCLNQLVGHICVSKKTLFRSWFLVLKSRSRGTRPSNAQVWFDVNGQLLVSMLCHPQLAKTFSTGSWICFLSDVSQLGQWDQFYLSCFKFVDECSRQFPPTNGKWW